MKNTDLHKPLILSAWTKLSAPKQVSLDSVIKLFRGIIYPSTCPKHNQRKRSSETFSDDLFSCLSVSQKKHRLNTTYCILLV
ncbi:hypothetical protein NEIMUCOT_06573 [Neisseria mucosa ATCC 25996]|uniref:Uncharacterized protein n=1 Tax=Neisseria mucosa (strain ATCC 25996 / DSM 4631 / NCTC 10774 / M26) TaxID=546266 RepID=D3A0Y2_NEIM2|nr:hypothetical protein NEIMUCOT_06573 [Neisseria mucosa ATCC 25996]